MFFILGGCLKTPTFVCPHMFICPQECTHPHMPPYSSVHLCVFGGLHVVGVVMGSPLCWDTSLTPPLFGGASPSFTPHTLSCWFPVHWYVSGISVCYVGISLLLKGLEVFPHQLGVLGASALDMSICSFLYIFCSALCLTF